MASKTRLQTSHEGSMEELITRICKQQADLISKKIDEQTQKFEKTLKSLVEEAKDIKGKVTVLEKNIATQEQFSKANNLIVYGIREDMDEHVEFTEEKVISLIKNKLNLDILPSDISRCFRIGRRNPNTHRPILVHFVSYKSKAGVYNSKKLLKKTGFVIKEDLTKTNLGLVKAAIEKYGLSNTWTQDGRVFVNKNGGKIWIRNMDELNTF